MIRRFCIGMAAATAALTTARPATAGEAIAAAPGAVEGATGLSNFGVSATIITMACILLLVLLFRGSASKVSRFISEKNGKRRLKRVLNRRSRDVLEDVILPGAYGGLTRIDYAILTSAGILCIRAKHCNGTVFGGGDDPQWKNVDGIYQHKFLNPAIQNAGRTRALQNIVPDVPVANLVVFTGAVQLAASRLGNVIHVRDLDSYIARFVFGPCKIKDWDAVWLTVRSALLTDEGSRRDFRAQLSFS